MRLRNALMGALWLLCASLVSVHAFDGLYYPKDDPEPWNCKAEDIGQYGGSLGVQEDKLYGVENTCTLTSPRTTVYGLEFIGLCSGEGDEYREIITLLRTPMGLTVTSNGHKSEWLQCP
ncbi:MAG: hypothetical protein AB8B94_15630 [Hyphomicrobiales bacterium]